MERRGFLGSLLALPFLNKIKPSKDINGLNVEIPLLDPNINKKLLGVIVRQDGSAEYIYEDDPMRYPQPVAGSGTFEGLFGTHTFREELI
jgi:hypothetical protein